MKQANVAIQADKIETNYYCTLFDSNYLLRGLAMYQSLVDAKENFFLYVFAFDNLARDILNELALPFVQVISLKEFETPELLEIKKTRTHGEYCWTCTPFSIWHILEKFSVPCVTYLDSDLFFYKRPSLILEEFHASGKDVLITRHNYTPTYDQTATSGVYCVQFMPFKNNANGRRVLGWWRDRCAEWCYERRENGKFGDQKYLDDWAERFASIVHVMQHQGGGLAPWNIQKFECEAGPKVNGVDAIFYHFHQFHWVRTHDQERFQQGGYPISESALNYLYRPYAEGLQKALRLVREKYDPMFIKGIQWPEYRIW